jgi:peptidoglycan DL-endopeptidase CwlO
LAQQIAAQATVLDQLGNQYGQAQGRVAAATQQAAALSVQLDASRVDEIRAQTDALAAVAALRNTAIGAYLGTNFRLSPAYGPYGPAYQAGLAHAYTGSVIRTVADRVQAQRVAHSRLLAVRKTIEARTRQAQTAQATAVAAATQVQAAVAAASVEQAKLTATVAQTQGGLAALVSAQNAATSQQIFTQLGGGRTLDFVPGEPLPGLLPQTAAAIAIAEAQVGKPYVWGAAGPDSFDCSGLMQWSWNQIGIKLPRVAADQQSWAIPVPISQVSPGDLVFFGSPAHHVGMYVGNGMMVDAPHSGALVGIVPIWWDQLSGFGRVHN